MGPAIFNALFILFFLCFLVFFIFLLLKKGKNNLVNKILIILAGVLIVFYVRVVVFYYNFFPLGDERKYAEILFLKQSGISHPISGPGYVDLITLISKLTSLNLAETAIYLGVLVSISAMVIFYIAYKRQTNNELISCLSVLLLMMTSYFIYPLIEARPQQIGMILVFIALILFYNYSEFKSRSSMIIFSAFYLFTFYYHILSFVLLSFAVFTIIFWFIIEKKQDYWLFILPVLLLIVCSLFYFAPGSGYERNKQDIIDTSIGLWSRIHLENLWIIPILALLIFIAMAAFLSYISKFEKEKNRKVKYFALSFIIAAFALALQFYINKEEYFNFYHNSFFYFLFFQTPNIILGIFYLFGIKDILENSKKQRVFFKASISLLILCILIVFPSLFLDSRLNNLFIRVLNYWTVFAAPIAAIPLKKIIKNKKTAAIFLSLLITIGVINASRNPLFFNYGS